MKLDRNITSPRRGKYALIKLRDAELYPSPPYNPGDSVSVAAEHVDFGDTEDTDFFVIRLKDKYAASALRAYAEAARGDDPEYAGEMDVLALIAENHPNRRMPD